MKITRVLECLYTYMLSEDFTIEDLKQTPDYIEIYTRHRVLNRCIDINRFDIEKPGMKMGYGLSYSDIMKDMKNTT